MDLSGNWIDHPRQPPRRRRQQVPSTIFGGAPILIVSGFGSPSTFTMAPEYNALLAALVSGAILRNTVTRTDETTPERDGQPASSLLCVAKVDSLSPERRPNVWWIWCGSAGNALSRRSRSLPRHGCCQETSSRRKPLAAPPSICRRSKTSLPASRDIADFEIGSG